MKFYLNILINCFLLITTSALLAIPHGEGNRQNDSTTPETHYENTTPSERELRKQKFLKSNPFTFDDLMEFMETIENGGFENFADFQLENLSIQLVYFAKRGLASNDETEKAIFENDITVLFTEFELREGEFSYKDAFINFPAMYQEQFCENPEPIYKKTLDKKRKSLQDFYNKYKKKIFVGGCVVVAVTEAAYLILATALDRASYTSLEHP